MQCASCGRTSPAGAAHCDRCGAVAVRVCPACGAAQRPSARFCHTCGRSLATAPSPPAVAGPAAFAGGRYIVSRFLGEGGKKRVYLAHDTLLDRDVAVAQVKLDGGLTEEDLARLRREAQAMGRLGDDPHVVTVYDIGEEGGAPFIVTQFMAGGDVETMLQHAPGHRLPTAQVLEIAVQVCRALEHAHARGIVHRDVKPSNIWLTADGTAKLGDFGLAIGRDQSRLTVAGMIVGTVAYMPPEQAFGRPPDARSDLYALGVTLYEMVTGRPPFLSDDAVAVIYQHIHTAPVAPSWHNREVPRALEALILRLLAKAPAERPASAAAVRETLLAIAHASTATASAEQERLLAAQAAANPLDRLAGGVFVGRERELSALRTRVDEMFAGAGGVVLLAGEPGIGKTRTAEELTVYARLRGAQVLWGRCYEGAGAPAFWPWVQLLRAYVQDREPAALRAELGAGAPAIAQIVSTVRERLPDLPEPPPLDPEQARFRLFDAVTTFLTNAAAAGGAPLLLILDDLHWADAPSLLLLQFLARELPRGGEAQRPPPDPRGGEAKESPPYRGARLLVLGTYRDVEVGRGHPLAPVLAELTRAHTGERIPLRGLDQRDVGRFMEMTAGLTPPESLIAAVYQETEGNPFFFTEVVRLLVADGRLERAEPVSSWSVAIPQSVREVVGRRLAHLSDECNRVLTIAAVIGREFHLATLEQVGDLSSLAGDRLLELLEEATAARVLAETADAAGRYSFTHALIRETLYDELSAARRVRLHRRVGEALERLHAADPGPVLAELAHHFVLAARGGDADKAAAYARRAGDRALALLAYEEAVRLYGLALEALEMGEPAASPQRGELLLALGDAQNRAGDLPGAKESFRQAAEAARRLAAPAAAPLLVGAALGYGGGVIVAGVVDTAGVGLLEEALAALDALGEHDSGRRARVMAELAAKLYYAGERERSHALSAAAVDMARRAGDPRTLTAALNNRRFALWGPGNVEQRLALSTELAQLADHIGDQEMALEGHLWRLIDLLELGDIDGVDAELSVHDRLAGELRQPLYQWHGAVAHAMRALMDGRFDEGERLAAEALAVGQRAHDPNALHFYGIQMTIPRREQGRIAQMEASTKRFVEQYPALPAWRCGLAYVYAEMEREAEARAEFERLAANDFADLPHDAAWLTGVTLLAQVCAFLGDARRAATLYGMLLPYAGRTIVVGSAVACYGPAAQYLGLLAATMDRWEEAARHFAHALEMGKRMRAQPFIARTRHAHAAMLLRRGRPGDHEQALALLDQALITARELGMLRLAEQVMTLKARSMLTA